MGSLPREPSELIIEILAFISACYKPSCHKQQGTCDEWVSKGTYKVKFYLGLKKKL